MQTYQQLLQQFHSEEASTIQENSHVQYIQLLNQLKTNKEKNNEKRNKILLESSRLKSSNKNLFSQSLLQKSMKAQRTQIIGDNFKEKMTLVELQKQSLVQQIDNINKASDQLKHQTTLVKQEIQMFDRKEVQILNAFNESINNVEELKRQIKLQQLINVKQSKQFNSKIVQMTKKTQYLNEQNVLNSKLYKEMSTVKTQNENKSLVGTILMWQNEQSKIKKIPKKIYTKNQIESMLRALFLITKLSNLNFGNIIEHLIRIAVPANKSKEILQTKKIYLNQKGQQIEVRDLVKILQGQLLTVNECKFLSKSKIIEFYARKGIVIFSNWQDNQLSSQTSEMIENVFKHYEKLTSWFSRIQSRNIQLTQNYQTLQKIDEELSKQIKSIQSSADQKSINYLQSRQIEIDLLHSRLNDSCKVIFQFNINLHDLIKHFQNLNKLFDKIVKSTNRKTYKKTFVQFQNDTQFITKITKILYKSPQCIIMDWNNVINNQKNESSFNSTDQSFQSIPDNEIYFETIMKNDLLRIYAEPIMYKSHKSCIENLQITFDYVIGQETQIIDKLSHILKDLLLFSKKGIQQFQIFKIPTQLAKKKISHLNSKETQDKLNPLLKLLQQAGSQIKLDKFFKQDEIKQDLGKQDLTKQDEKHSSQQKFCVQSNDYYRRDDFKLIEKLQRINLKKKGLLPSVPFLVNTSLQLESHANTLDNILCDKSISRSGSTRNSHRNREPRLSHQLLSNRHNMLSQLRQKQNSRKKNLKLLLNNISNIASQNNKYRIKKKANLQQIPMSVSTSRIKTNFIKMN